MQGHAKTRITSQELALDVPSKSSHELKPMTAESHSHEILFVRAASAALLLSAVAMFAVWMIDDSPSPKKLPALAAIALMAAGFVLLLTARHRHLSRLATEDVRRQHDTLAILNRVSSTLVAEMDLQKIVQSVTDAGREITGAAFGAFFYKNENEHGESYLLYTLSGAPREAFAKFPTPRPTELFAPIFEGRGPVRIGNVLKDARYGKSAPHHGMPPGHLKVQSYLAAPVISRGGGVLGGLFFGHPEPDVFSPESETTLVGLAALASIAIDNANLYATTQREMAKLAQARNELLASEARLRTLAESLPHLVWTCRPDGWCDYLSRQWVEYTGQPESEQLGSAWAAHLHPDDREHVRAEWIAATARGDVYDVEFRIRRADGVYRWFKTRAVPLRDGAGNIVKWFGSNTDFDDFKRGEGHLNAQLARLSLLDRTTRAIGERQDLHSVFQVVLRSLEDHLPIDFGCACLYSQDDDSMTVECVGPASHSLAQELSLTEFARVRIDENGLSRCMRGELVHEPDIAESRFAFPARLARVGLNSLVIAPLMVESKVFGVIIAARRASSAFTSGDCEFLRQLTQHVALAAHQAQLYDSLQIAYDDLRQSQTTVMQQERLRSLGQMASGIAHDINNALSPAALYAETLLEREKNLSDTARKNLVVIQHAIESVAQTVARMREFYRPRETQLALVPVDLNHTVEQVIALTHARWSDIPQERGVVIRLCKELDQPAPAAMGVEADIRDAITNLILNAIDAMPDGGTLTIRSRSAASRVSIEVCDTGVGMSETVRNRCLDPFYTTKGERGTGLGLAMVYGMVQRHNAELDIESELGAGTTMRIVFPSTASVGASPRPAAMQSARALRILLIDDDLVLLKSLRDTLEHEGHVVETADGGQAGIDAFATAKQKHKDFEIVITDLGMPHVDGRTVALAIKRTSPVTPVIMLTGWGHRLNAENNVPEHVDRLLSKPPKLGELRAAITELGAR